MCIFAKVTYILDVPSQADMAHGYMESTWCASTAFVIMHFVAHVYVTIILTFSK